MLLKNVAQKSALNIQYNILMDDYLNIIFTIDEKFIQHFAVTLISLLENNKDLNLSLYVIHDIKDISPLKEVENFVKSKYGISFHLIYVDNTMFDHYRISAHYSKAVYYRLIITELVPDTIDTALFLDSDTVVTGSLRELARHRFNEGEYLLAVDDTEVSSHVARLNAMGFPVKRYFNAGVLLINMKAWRADQVSKKLIALANDYMDRLSWWDQDILNMHFYNVWQDMDPKFNAIHLRRRLPVLPVIIHYAGTSKPWLYAHTHPYKSVYWEYIKLTPYKNARYPDLNLKEFLRKYYIGILNILGLREPAVFKE